ncbi:hypothetical protein CDB3_29375 [Bacillus sp. CDB3]|nr:hypothetical protein CDB3_29375 [Bacillus sp. CDB3]
MRYFKGKQFKKDIIIVAVGYYCRFSLSYRDVSEILKERGVSVHPTTIMRWVHEQGNLIYQIWKKKNKSALHAWHLDETYIKVKGKWCFAKSTGFQNLLHASRIIKGIETIHALYKQKRSLQQSNFVFSTYNELQHLFIPA